MATPRSPSAECTTSKLAKLTLRAAASVKISAAAPGRSGMGIRTSSTSSKERTRAGRWERAFLALERNDSSSPVFVPSIMARNWPNSAMKSSSVSKIATRFSRQMSSQIPGLLDAIRVISRKPPAAILSTEACSSDRASATLIRVAAAKCGTWLTTAMSRS